MPLTYQMLQDAIEEIWASAWAPVEVIALNPCTAREVARLSGRRILTGERRRGVRGRRRVLMWPRFLEKTRDG